MVDGFKRKITFLILKYPELEDRKNAVKAGIYKGGWRRFWQRMQGKYGNESAISGRNAIST
jgi:hypothetical protein